MPNKKRTKKINSNNTQPNEAKAYIAVVLDRSGSMHGCKEATIDNYNNEIHKTLKDSNDKYDNVLISLVTFNDYVEFKYFNQNPSVVRRLNDENYNPEGGTAMYDAVVETVDRFKKETDYKNKNNKYVIIVISDGNENASEKHNRSDVVERVQTLQKLGNWTFVYLGANQDLSMLEDETNISKNNTAYYSTTHNSIKHAYHTTSRALDHAISGSVAGTAYNPSKFYSYVTGNDDVVDFREQESKTNRR